MISLNALFCRRQQNNFLKPNLKKKISKHFQLTVLVILFLAPVYRNATNFNVIWPCGF